MKAGWYRAGVIAVALAGIGVAGCSRSEPEPPVEGNMTIQELESTPEPSPTPEATPVEEPVAAPVNDTAALPPPEEDAPDEQMLDDASATGMTARAERDQPDAEPTRPVRD